jgi:hypothetical protein
MTRTACLVLFAAALILFPACGSELETQGEDPLKARAPTYALKSSDLSSSTPEWKSSYVIASTSEVWLATEITGTLSGHHTQRVVVKMPGGSAYQTIMVSFATDAVAAEGEQQAVRTSTGWRVWASFPVAGTIIEQYGLTGSWTSEAFVDSATRANATTTFTLQ